MPLPASSLKNPPISATHTITGFIGLVAMIAMIMLLKDMDIAPHLKTIAVIGASAAAMIAYDVFFQKTYSRETTGLDWKNWKPNIRRSGVKILGLFLTFTLLANLYILFPEYDKKEYFWAWQMVQDAFPYAAIFSVFYIVIVDGAMTSPKDGYYAAGLIAMGRMKEADVSRIPHHIRSWIIKGFFVPLMFCYLTQNINGLPARLDSLEEMFRLVNLVAIFGFLWVSLLTIDLAFTVIGYLFAFRVIDTHERSADPAILGWVAALICYQPFWSLFEKSYFDYQRLSPNWDNFYAQHPLFVGIWGGLLIALTIIYAWSTMAFGMRFSNLTHRGIITSGPYRFTKHPAYISKNLSWWLLFAPFMAFSENASMAFQNCLLLLMVNGIYYLRAVTEERHLSQDPVYREYQTWMSENGIFRKFAILKNR